MGKTTDQPPDHITTTILVSNILNSLLSYVNPPKHPVYTFVFLGSPKKAHRQTTGRLFVVRTGIVNILSPPASKCKYYFFCAKICKYLSQYGWSVDVSVCYWLWMNGGINFTGNSSFLQRLSLRFVCLLLCFCYQLLFISLKFDLKFYSMELMIPLSYSFVLYLSYRCLYL